MGQKYKGALVKTVGGRLDVAWVVGDFRRGQNTGLFYFMKFLLSSVLVNNCLKECPIFSLFGLKERGSSRVSLYISEDNGNTIGGK